jgi:hypothetical protein
VLHHVCGGLATAVPILASSHELHGYRHLATLPTREGTGDVVDDNQEQSALHPLLLSHLSRGSAQKRLHSDAEL